MSRKYKPCYIYMTAKIACFYIYQHHRIPDWLVSSMIFGTVVIIYHTMYLLVLEKNVMTTTFFQKQERALLLYK